MALRIVSDKHLTKVEGKLLEEVQTVLGENKIRLVELENLSIGLELNGQCHVDDVVFPFQSSNPANYFPPWWKEVAEKIGNI